MSRSALMRSTVGRWSAYALVAVAFAVACGFLSHWQFERSEARAAMLELVEANYDAASVPVEEILDRGYTPSDEWRPVTLAGRYLPEDQLLVRNRAQGGTSAFEVIVPFELADGRVVAVDRGWVPPGEDAVPDAVPAPPAGDVTVVARVRPGEPLPSSGRGAPDGQLPTIHLATLAGVTGARTETAFYGLMVSEDPAAPQRPAQLKPPTDDPGPHLSYAIQWILFAVMGFGFIAYMIRTEIRARREDAEADEESPMPPAATRPAYARRRDRDADEEDALLDAGR